MASRPRSAAPAKVTPSPPPPGLRVSACIANPPVRLCQNKTKTGRRGRPPYGCGPTFNVRREARCASIRWAPPVPSLLFFGGDEELEERKGVLGRGRLACVGGGLGEIFDGAAERGRLAHETIICLRDRPSEHSVENLSEPDDQKQRTGEPPKWIRIA